MTRPVTAEVTNTFEAAVRVYHKSQGSNVKMLFAINWIYNEFGQDEVLKSASPETLSLLEQAFEQHNYRMATS